MKLLLAFPVIFLFSAHFLHAQVPKKQEYHPPLNIPLILSSNFGELRPNHFHMGVDFKTNGRIGYNLYSIEDGYVSRIKVSPYGYGKVIYIDHPNGITSVYAHCSAFKGAIDSIVRATQQAEQNFAVEVFPKPNEIPVSKGERIAISGNSGSSTAPHLHFEIRDTKTEVALNPLVFGFDVADHQAPELRHVKVYALTKEGYRHPGKSLEVPVKKNGQGYYIAPHTIHVPASFGSMTGGIGFAFDVIDRLDGANNQCGLYGSILIIDGDTIFGQKTDRVPFESTRYVNSHKDYEAYSAQRRNYHKCFKTNENDLPIYPYRENGVISIQAGQTLNVHYIAFDPKGNRSEIRFKAVVERGSMNEHDRFFDDLTYLRPSHPLQMETSERQVEFGITTTYEPLKMDISNLDHAVGRAEVPVHKAYRLKLESAQPNDGKNYVEILTHKGKYRSIVAQYDSGWYYVDSKYFGAYSLKRDTTAPVITPLHINALSTTQRTFKWKISDNQTEIADYDLFIDGKWYLIEYESKGSYITFRRPEELKGEYEVLLKVTDECGNVQEWKRTMHFR